jgi:4-hydroxybenzoate polyprenyltransferase
MNPVNWSKTQWTTALGILLMGIALAVILSYFLEALFWAALVGSAAAAYLYPALMQRD